MDSKAFEGIGVLITTLGMICLVSVPFGLWKLAELTYWLWEKIAN